jgi:hypothetical protein
MIELLGTAYALAKEAYGYYKDAKEVFDASKGAYEAAKDIKEHFEVKEGEPKLVDFGWPDVSGFQAKEQGYEVAWSKPDRVASREIDGYEVMYEIDKNANTKRKLVLRDGLVLIGRKVRA